LKVDEFTRLPPLLHPARRAQALSTENRNSWFPDSGMLTSTWPRQACFHFPYSIGSAAVKPVGLTISPTNPLLFG